MKHHLMLGAASAALLLMAASATLAAETAAAPPPAAEADAEVSQIVVTSKGATRAENVLNQSTVSALGTGVTGYNAIALLPGVTHTGADQFGAYDWANRLVVRSFQYNQLGFTLDGVPLGNPVYATYNGLSPHRAIDSTNIGTIAVAQGAGTLDTAANQSLGGTIKYATRAPGETLGGYARVMFGSEDANEIFGRLDTGLMPGGGRGWVSLKSSNSDKWKGAADNGYKFGPFDRSDPHNVKGAGGDDGNYHDQINLKYVQPLGAKAKATAYFDYSTKDEQDYQDILPGYAGKIKGYDGTTYGREFDNYVSWNDAIKDTAELGYYRSARGYRRDYLGYVKLDAEIAPGVDISIQPYAHDHDGWGDYHTPIYSGGVMKNMAFRRSYYSIDRGGVLGKLSTVIAGTTVQAGGWYENNQLHWYRARYAATDWTKGPQVDFTRVVDSSGAAATLLDFDRHLETKTFIPYVELSRGFMDDRLKIDGGVKAIDVKTTFDAQLSRAEAAISGRELKTEKHLLPQVGATYAVTERDELFAGYTRNASALPIDIFTTTDFATSSKAKPEETDTFEAGYRLNREKFAMAATVFYVDYKNRLLGIRNCSLTATCPAVLANVGNAKNYGLEVSATLRPTEWLTWYNGFSVQDPQYKSDYVSGGVTFKTNGKTVVESPKFQYSSQVEAKANGWEATLSLKHVGDREATYLNDLQFKAYTLVDLSVGYELEKLGAAKGLRAQINVFNLFDENYIASNSYGFGASDPTGAGTYVQYGAPRSVYFTLSSSF